MSTVFLKIPLALIATNWHPHPLPVMFCIDCNAYIIMQNCCVKYVIVSFLRSLPEALVLHTAMVLVNQICAVLLELERPR